MGVEDPDKKKEEKQDSKNTLLKKTLNAYKQKEERDISEMFDLIQNRQAYEEERDEDETEFEKYYEDQLRHSFAFDPSEIDAKMEKLIEEKKKKRGFFSKLKYFNRLFPLVRD